MQNAREAINFDGRADQRPADAAATSTACSTLTPGSRATTGRHQPVRRARRLRRRHRRVLQPRPQRLQRRRHGDGTDQQSRAGPRDGRRPGGQRRRRGARSSARPAATRPTSPTPRKSTSRCRARSANRRPAAPRSTSCRGPAATVIAGDFNTTYTTERWFDRNNSAYPDTSRRRFQAGQERSRRVDGVRRSDQARPAVVLLGRRATRASTSCRSASTSGRT